MIIDFFSANLEVKVKNYLKVILNSAYHLQNVIEDALDMSRIENNKFSIFKEMFDIKSSVNEVCDIMRFQFESKNLALKLTISPKVPLTLLTD